MCDFKFENFGSVSRVEAVSEAAKELANEHFDVDGWQGVPTNFTTDWRAAEALADRLECEGFEVERA